MCPAVDSASKNEYQVNPAGKGGRCVKLTTYHHVPIAKKSGGLNLLKSCGPVEACTGTDVPLPLPLKLSWTGGGRWGSVLGMVTTPGAGRCGV